MLLVWLLVAMVTAEVVAAATAARHENAWVTGGGIDWGRVAPGGSSHHGSASSSSHGSASSSNGGSTEHGSSSGGSSNANAPTSPQTVSRGELRDLAEELYRLDTHGATARAIVNPQGRTSSASTADHAPQNLFTSVSPRALSSPTFAALLVLLDNYEASVLQAEQDTFHERQEQDDFLQAVMATKIMARAEQFLTSKGLITSALKDVLREIWFTTYSRSRRTLGSSGFEHVFVGETKNGEVSGFHNWVNFYIQEQEGHLDYFGHMKTVDLGDHAQIILLKFKWVDEAKPYGSMLVGTSPEFDLALYTVCFFARPGANCPVKVNGHNFNIKTYYQDYRGKRYVGTAFPNI